MFKRKTSKQRLDSITSEIKAIQETLRWWMEQGSPEKDIRLSIGELQELQEAGYGELFLIALHSVFFDRVRRYRKDRLKGREKDLDNLRAMFHFYTSFAYKWAMSELNSDEPSDQFHQVQEAMKGEGEYWNRFAEAGKKHLKASWIAGFLVDRMFDEAFDRLQIIRPKEHKDIRNFIKTNCDKRQGARESADEVLTEDDTKDFFLNSLLRKI